MDASTKLLLNIFSILAEFERDLLSERTKEGLKAVKNRGVKLGRPTKYTINDFKTNSFYANKIWPARGAAEPTVRASMDTRFGPNSCQYVAA